MLEVDVGELRNAAPRVRCIWPSAVTVTLSGGRAYGMAVAVVPYGAICMTERNAGGVGTEEYTFGRWRDETAVLPNLDGCDMTKLYLTKDYGFIDGAAETRHSREFAGFKLRTPRDVNMDFSNYAVIPGLKERTLCYVNVSGPPGWVNLPCFIAASALMCTLPYRMLFDRSVAEQTHLVYKLIGD